MPRPFLRRIVLVLAAVVLLSTLAASQAAAAPPGEKKWFRGAGAWVQEMITIDDNFWTTFNSDTSTFEELADRVGEFSTCQARLLAKAGGPVSKRSRAANFQFQKACKSFREFVRYFAQGFIYPTWEQAAPHFDASLRFYDDGWHYIRIGIAKAPGLSFLCQLKDFC